MTRPFVPPKFFGEKGAKAMVHIIDTLHLGEKGVIAVFAMETSEGLLLLEAGPENSFPQVVAGLQGFGHDFRAVRHVLLTHIHLDHAGAAWRWASLGATIYVHPRGAPHLIDPSRLLASVQRLYGSGWKSLLGEVRPIPPERVCVVRDGDVLHFGGVTVEVIETQGHAVHHHAYRVEDFAFVGDVAGVRVEGGPVVPPCPPPDIHLEQWLSSLDRLLALNLHRLYLTHFGAYDDVPDHLNDLRERLQRWAEWVRKGLREGREENLLVPAFEGMVDEELRSLGLDEGQRVKYRRANTPSFTLYGLARYWRKHHPEKLKPFTPPN